MSTKLKEILSIFFFVAIFFNFVSISLQDEPCPYPCYPPPTGTGTPTTTTPTPPVMLPPPSQAGSYTPPSGFNYPTTPAGNIPNYPSPPYGNNYNSNPPPDPILPYFPYYFRKPPHKTDDQSSATALGRANLMIGAISLVVYVFL